MQPIETEAAFARYSGVAKALHWTIAGLIVTNLALGPRLEATPGPATPALFQLHKSIGITVLLLTLLRIAWRLIHPAPPFRATLKGWERGLARTVHFTFYLLLLGLPLSGWLLISTAKRKFPTELYGTVRLPDIPVAAAQQAALHNVANAVHHLLPLLAYLLIALHLAGALKHHFYDRDGELTRMVPGKRRVASWDWRLGAIIASIVAIIALARTYPWGA